MDQYLLALILIHNPIDEGGKKAKDVLILFAARMEIIDCGWKVGSVALKMDGVCLLWIYIWISATYFWTDARGNVEWVSGGYDCLT